MYGCVAWGGSRRFACYDYARESHAAACTNMQDKNTSRLCNGNSIGCNAVKWKEMDLQRSTQKDTIIIPNLHFKLNFLPLLFENWKYNPTQNQLETNDVIAMCSVVTFDFLYLYLVLIDLSVGITIAFKPISSLCAKLIKCSFHTDQCIFQSIVHGNGDRTTDTFDTYLFESWTNHLMVWFVFKLVQKMNTHTNWWKHWSNGIEHKLFNVITQTG